MEEQIQVTPLPTMTDVWQKTFNWQPSDDQQLKLETLYQGVITANQQLNLTRITKATDFWEKHIWDSLSGVLPRLQTQSLPESGHVIDIGTGAGFPGLPIAITCPNYHVTLLDSTQKKIAFLHRMIAELGLENAEGVPGRAEEINYQPQYYRHYDLATLRAVAPAPQCAQYALPFLKPNGVAILYRGHWSVEEEQTLTPMIKKLGAILESVVAWETPLTQSIRHCLYLRKTCL